MWTSNRICLCGSLHKGTEIDSINFPMCGSYFTVSQEENSNCGPTPFSLSILTSDECGILKIHHLFLKVVVFRVQVTWCVRAASLKRKKEVLLPLFLPGRGEQGDKGQSPTIFEELDLCWRTSAFLGLGYPTCSHVWVCKFMLIN